MRIIKSTFFILSAILAFGLGSCDETDTNPKTPYVPAVKGDYYAEASLNGGALLLSEGEDKYISTTGASEIVSGSGCWQTQDIILKKQTNDLNSLRISFIQEFEACPTQCSALESMLQKGKYAFGKTAAATGKAPVEGVVITFTDAEGTVWATDKGTGRQQGSIFIVNAFDNNTKDTESAKVTEAQFNAVLYDGTGREIRLTNGNMVSRSLNCSTL